MQSLHQHRMQRPWAAFLVRFACSPFIRQWIFIINLWLPHAGCLPFMSQSIGFLRFLFTNMTFILYTFEEGKPSKGHVKKAAKTTPYVGYTRVFTNHLPHFLPLDPQQLHPPVAPVLHERLTIAAAFAGGFTLSALDHLCRSLKQNCSKATRCYLIHS